MFVDNRWSVGQHGIARFSREVLRRLGLPVVELRGNPAAPSDLLRVGRLRMRSGDVLFSPGFNAGLTRARQVLTIHDLIHLDDADESSLRKRAYYHNVVRPVVSRSGLVLTVSRSSQRRLEEWLGPGVEVVNVGNGADPVFAPDPNIERLRGEFVFVGGTRSHKRLHVALDAVKAVGGSALTVVTQQPEEVTREVGERALEGRVTVLSGLSDREMAGLYQRSAALLMPSSSEGFGLPALEAARCGALVVFWKGCEPVVEIVGSRGLGIENIDDRSEWAAALRQLSGESPVPAISQEDLDRLRSYNWDDVAYRVRCALEGVG